MVNYKRSVFIMAALIIIFPLVFLLLIVPLFSRFNIYSENSDREYHIIVIGQSENLSLLNQVYTGAERVSSQYKAIVEI